MQIQLNYPLQTITSSHNLPSKTQKKHNINSNQNDCHAFSTIFPFKRQQKEIKQMLNKFTIFCLHSNFSSKQGRAE